jgi:hypothetical protein
MHPRAPPFKLGQWSHKTATKPAEFGDHSPGILRLTVKYFRAGPGQGIQAIIPEKFSVLG